MNEPESTYSQTKGLQLLNAVVEDFGPLFKLENVREKAHQQGISQSQVTGLLSLLARSRWIIRLKRGLYVIQSPIYKPGINPYAIATALIQPSAISHWSALAHHGMTTQIPPMIQVSTPAKVVTPDMRRGTAYRPRGRAAWKVLDIEIEFIRIKQQHFYGFVQEWVSSWHRVSITDKERTCLDLVAFPDIFGSMLLTIETIESQLDTLDIELLIEYGLRYQVGSVIKRLGWILETLAIPDELLRPLEAVPVQNDYPLDPKRPRTGKRSTRWRILDNLFQK